MRKQLPNQTLQLQGCVHESASPCVARSAAKIRFMLTRNSAVWYIAVCIQLSENRLAPKVFSLPFESSRVFVSLT